MRLNEILEQVLKDALPASRAEWEALLYPSPADLLDPLGYKNMEKLIVHLHEFQKKQQADEHLLLVIDGDYDTDGVCATVILTAALSLLGFRIRVYIPSMAEGYGLSETAVYQMKEQFEKNGDRIGMILTADNGIRAFRGIALAKQFGISVLVTDHHEPGDRLPDADCIVDAYQPGDFYSFKGNSGATVAWKVCLAYASRFQKEALPLIEKLVVFAGISTISDVMPLLSENRYLVKAALKRLTNISEENPHSGCPLYDTAFQALNELIWAVSKLQMNKHAAKGKSSNSFSLPENEDFIGFYIAPLLNAPRRVHDTCLEALSPFLVTDPSVRKIIIDRLLDLNEERIALSDALLKEVETKYPSEVPMVLTITANRGMAGLVAGRLCERTGRPSIVFCESKTRLYGSARSNESYSLLELQQKVNEKHPNLISGGGHSTSAGYSIAKEDLTTFQTAFAEAVAEWEEERVETVAEPEHLVCLTVTADGIKASWKHGGTLQEDQIDTTTLATDIETILHLYEKLRPFGAGFDPRPTIYLQFDKMVLEQPKWKWNPNFWKTFKFELFGVECLTFDTVWANRVKEQLPTETITAKATLRLNTFLGRTKPQMQLTPI